jgi:hypothetical protein
LVADESFIKNRETDLSTLSNGIYLIRLEKNGVSVAGKWIQATR